MSNCELLDGCIFFNDQMATKPNIAKLYKTNYCKGNSADCARYRVYSALGREKVPKDLYPNQVDRATEIISKG